MYLIAATSSGVDWHGWGMTAWGLTQAVLVLGVIIFVHELGHFAVAKLCGVKCEKFYLGFDIYGLKLLKFRWGETEYGIGAFPIGGYVKMLGQEDNPTRVYEEMQRAKLQGDVPGDDQPPALDPRSYLAKSVWQRMAIISAGVVMNVIFAFFCAVAAYQIGVKYPPCIISGVVPGQPAWQADLQVGDEVVRIGDLENPGFRDLSTKVALGDLAEGVRLKVLSGGETRELVLHPRQTKEAPRIGVINARSTELVVPLDKDNEEVAFDDDSSFRTGDRVIAIAWPENDEWQEVSVGTYADIHRVFAVHQGDPLRVTVEREQNEAEKGLAEKAASRQLTREVPPEPVHDFGLVMTLGKVRAVQDGSPAEAAGLLADDQIVEITAEDGTTLLRAGEAPEGDPMRLEVMVRPYAGQTLAFTVRRAGQSEPLNLSITPDVAMTFEWPYATVGGDTPMSSPSIGIAYDVLPQIAAVRPDSPAAKAGLRAGEVLTSLLLLPPENYDGPSLGKTLRKPQVLDPQGTEWVGLLALVQDLATEDFQFEFTVEGRPEPVELGTTLASDWYLPEHEMHFNHLLLTRKAATFSEAIALGGQETKDAVLLVYRFLQKLTQQQVSAKTLGGPITIFDQASQSAQAGLSTLLIFCTLLSANLAVINFLPIPLLDGGHMVFLIFEAIRRKPPSEKVFIAVQYVGFLFILSVMGFVLFLDISRLLPF